MTIRARACTRCGVIRSGRDVADLCHDCYYLPEGGPLAPPPGQWVRVGAILRWESHLCEDCGGLLLPGDRCDTCLTWAIKNARDHEWAQLSRQNRPILWRILEAATERRAA